MLCIAQHFIPEKGKISYCAVTLFRFQYLKKTHQKLHLHGYLYQFRNHDTCSQQNVTRLSVQKNNSVESTIIMPFLIKYYMELYIHIYVNPLKLYSNTKRSGSYTNYYNTTNVIISNRQKWKTLSEFKRGAGNFGLERIGMIE